MNQEYFKHAELALAAYADLNGGIPDPTALEKLNFLTAKPLLSQVPTKLLTVTATQPDYQQQYSDKPMILTILKAFLQSVVPKLVTQQT